MYEIDFGQEFVDLPSKTMWIPTNDIQLAVWTSDIPQKRHINDGYKKNTWHFVFWQPMFGSTQVWELITFVFLGGSHVPSTKNQVETYMKTPRVSFCFYQFSMIPFRGAFLSHGVPVAFSSILGVFPWQTIHFRGTHIFGNPHWCERKYQLWLCRIWAWDPPWQSILGRKFLVKHLEGKGWIWRDMRLW